MQVRVADIAHDTGKFGLERKKEGDFWKSLIDRRIYEQLQNTARVYGKFGGLVMEGLINNVIMEHPGHEDWIRSIKGECWNLGIHFEECEQQEDIVKLVKWLDKKVGEEIKNRGTEITVALREDPYEALRRCKRIGDEKADMLFFLFKNLKTMAIQGQGTFQGLPGIGPETAKELYDFFNKTVVRTWIPKPRKRKQKEP